MPRFRALREPGGEVLGETEAETIERAIAWAQQEFSAKQPRTSSLVVEKQAADGSWAFAHSTSASADGD